MLFTVVSDVEFYLCMKICRECFYEVFEEEIHRVIVENRLFKPGERIAIGASGGKGEHACFLYNGCKVYVSDCWNPPLGLDMFLFFKGCIFLHIILLDYEIIWFSNLLICVINFLCQFGIAFRTPKSNLCKK